MSCHRQANRILTRLAGTALPLGDHAGPPPGAAATNQWAEVKRVWRDARQGARRWHHPSPLAQQCVTILAQAMRWMAGEGTGGRQNYVRDYALANMLYALHYHGLVRHCARCGAFVGPDGGCMRAGCGGRDEGPATPGARWAQEFLAQIQPAVQAVDAGLAGLNRREENPALVAALARTWQQRLAPPRTVQRRPPPSAGGARNWTEVLLRQGAFAVDRGYWRGLRANLPADCRPSALPPRDGVRPLDDPSFRTTEFNAPRLAQGKFGRGEWLTDEEIQEFYALVVESLQWVLDPHRVPRFTPAEVLRTWSHLQVLEIIKRARRIPGFVDETAVLPLVDNHIQTTPVPATTVFNPGTGQQRGLPPDDRLYALPEIPPLPPTVAPATIGVRLPAGEDPHRWTAAGFTVIGGPAPPVDLTLSLLGEAEADFNAGAQLSAAGRYAALGELAPLVTSNIETLRELAGRAAAVEVTMPTEAGEEALTLPAQVPLTAYFPFVRQAVAGPTWRLTVCGDEIIHACGGAGQFWAAESHIPVPAARLGREALRRLGWDAGLVEVVHNEQDGRWYVRDADSGFRNAPAPALQALGRALQRTFWLHTTMATP